MSQLAAWLVACTLCLLSLSADKPRSETPEEAVGKMVQASKAGDIEGFLDTLESDYAAAMRAQYEAEVAKDKFIGALDEKFGKVGTGVSGEEAMKQELMALRNMEILEKAGEGQEKAILKIKVTTRGKDGEDLSKTVEWTAVKGIGGWKLLPPNAPDAKTLSKIKETAKRFKAIADRVREEVMEGKYQSREEAEKAFRSLL